MIVNRTSGSKSPKNSSLVNNVLANSSFFGSSSYLERLDLSLLGQEEFARINLLRTIVSVCFHGLELYWVAGMRQRFTSP